MSVTSGRSASVRLALASLVGGSSMIARFKAGVGGNAMATFAVASIPVFGLVAAGLDYSRAAKADTHLQAAADLSLLAAARDAGASLADKKRVADTWLNQEMLGSESSLVITGTSLVQDGDKLIYSANATIKAQMGGFVGQSTLSIGARSVVRSGGPDIEMALVLDNTGSMHADMDDLREASRDLVNQVFATDDGAGKIKAAIVPFVASVNPGAGLNMSMMDVNADSRHHGAIFEWRWVAKLRGCTPVWGGGGGGGGDGPGDGGDGASLWDRTRSFAGFVIRETIGVSTAQAAWQDGAAFGLPSGYGVDNCFAVQPGKVNHFALFNAVNVQWKGCVEARPEPYDVDDTAPNPAVPDTLFVPYFWPDESDKFADWVPRYNNNWMVDGPYLDPTRWENQDDTDWHRSYNLTKYVRGKTRSIDEVGPSTSGPNRSCPDAIQPLTSSKATLTTKIDGLVHWNGGGTIASEGVAWGLRVLSPTPPFTEGKPYGTKNLKKIMVVMSDGQNLIGENNKNGPTISDYTAYGYMRWGRFPRENFQVAKEHINSRLLQACRNAKEKDITVYTILFRETDAATVNLFEQCASKPPYFFKARTALDLKTAFNTIGADISKLRIAE